MYSLGKGESVGDKLIFASFINNDIDLFVTDKKNKNYVVKCYTNCTNTQTIIAVVTVISVNVVRIEVEVTSISSIINRRTPIVTVETNVG